ncbi:GNAT family N-acetyltransferase [Candidatus Gottesmanbacteria bacterium]|nr:GNAT family N-acetyltransferase [Candidatus Gottesmanbacteria bacterium]
MDHPFQITEKTQTDNAWISNIATQMWGSVEIISKEHVYNILNLPTLVGTLDGNPVGFISYIKDKNSIEIVALYCEVTNKGLGTTFIDRVKERAKEEGCSKVWLMTTNDNTQALRFYQKRGFVITAIHINEMEKQRKLKPSIPLLGNDRIPIRDEIELEVEL